MRESDVDTRCNLIRATNQTLWGGGKQKTLCITLSYVKITTSGVNCTLKNLRGEYSRSGKVSESQLRVGIKPTTLY